MVHRLLALAPGALLLALPLALLVPAGANADNRRISISDYRWSQPEIQLDLGEHVSWYWIGPDTMHSVTGTSLSAEGLDSDPGTSQPRHAIGDTFQLAFDSPGVYEFHCKLHSTVRGEITVSANPGDPEGEIDPVPRSRVDLTPPRLRDVQLGAAQLGRRGTSLRFALGERAKLDADLYRYDAEGGRHFAGYRSWPGHVGFNGVRIGGRSKHFRPRPGSYLAVLRATDEARNTSAPKRRRFTIRRR